MRLNEILLAAFALNTAASVLKRRDDSASDASPDVTNVESDDDGWQPMSKTPHFFNVKIDEACAVNEAAAQCPFDNFALRLEKGIAVATPYNKWWDPKLPTFFVDEDTQIYTVSKEPLQLYVDSSTGALRYTKVGYLPPNAISTSFFHTGNNPLGNVDPSPSYLTWPSTPGGSPGAGRWWLCELGSTGQWQVFVNYSNFESAGVNKTTCRERSLAAINANPWKKQTTYGMVAEPSATPY